MSGTNPKAFDPKVVLGLVLVGAIAFVATLYFIGTGNTGRDINNGGAHASAKGLNGFAGLATLLEESGHEITFARSPGRLEDEVLVIRDSEESMALSQSFLLDHPTYQTDDYVIITSDGGANRVYRKNEKGDIKIPYKLTEEFIIPSTGEPLSRVASHRTFWFAWYNMHPETLLIK